MVGGIVLDFCASSVSFLYSFIIFWQCQPQSNGLWKCRCFVTYGVAPRFTCTLSYFQMRKKLKESEASDDEKKDADDADEQKKLPSPAREESSPHYFDSASGPPGYFSHCHFPVLLWLTAGKLCSFLLYMGWHNKLPFGLNELSTWQKFLQYHASVRTSANTAITLEVHWILLLIDKPVIHSVMFAVNDTSAEVLAIWSSSYRVSNNPGNPGNLLEFIVLLEFLKFYWNFVKSTGNSLHIY